LPPDPRPGYGASDPDDPQQQPSKGVLSLVCPDADEACGESTRGWLPRAQQAMKLFALAQAKHSSSAQKPEVQAQKPEDTCASEARVTDEKHRYTAWRRCLESRREQLSMLPFGKVRAPDRGWLVLRGRRGHYHFCDELRIYDLSTGGAYIARSCSGLALRQDGSVDGAVTRANSKRLVERGRFSIDNLRELELMLVIAPTAKTLQASALYYKRPEALPRRWVPDGLTSHSIGLGSISYSSAQTQIAWAWIDDGHALAEGTVTWPASSNSGAEAHATDLMRTVEAGLTHACPQREVPPQIGLVLPKRFGAGDPVSDEEIQMLQELVKPTACK